jgi:hypothetical protein
VCGVFSQLGRLAPVPVTEDALRMWLPMSLIGPRLGCVPLPVSYWPLLRTQLADVALTQLMKVAGT